MNILSNLLLKKPIYVDVDLNTNHKRTLPQQEIRGDSEHGLTPHVGPYDVSLVQKLPLVVGNVHKIVVNTIMSMFCNKARRTFLLWELCLPWLHRLPRLYSYL
jgi:hypothetical protein